ncbi:hypothetical protein CDAR_167971 [Caerostris darwini]|uniref:Uncharacterized protein n=1 Tax=Caerostris darwini TaxID=1538125 RepID=A0AAV4VJA8_9ARAC|nr:hypothetical protein CDAR_167971 [Caerostris darwini]
MMNYEMGMLRSANRTFPDEIFKFLDNTVNYTELSCYGAKMMIECCGLKYLIGLHNPQRRAIITIGMNEGMYFGSLSVGKREVLPLLCGSLSRIQENTIYKM